MALCKLLELEDAEILRRYETVKKNWNVAICASDSPSFEKFISILLTCTNIFFCSNECSCICHVGKLGQLQEIPSVFFKPSLFSVLGCKLKQLPLGSGIDIGSFGEEDEYIFTFGGQFITIGDDELSIRDAVLRFKQEDDWKNKFETSVEEIYKLVKNAKDCTLNNINNYAGEEDEKIEDGVSLIWSTTRGDYVPVCDCCPNIELFRNAPPQLLDFHGISSQLNTNHMYCQICDSSYHLHCYQEEEIGEPGDKEYSPFFCKECIKRSMCTPSLISLLRGKNEYLDAEKWKYYVADIRIDRIDLEVKLLVAVYKPRSFVASSLLFEESKRLFPTPMAYITDSKYCAPITVDEAFTSLYLSVCIQHKDDNFDSQVVNQPPPKLNSVHSWINVIGQNYNSDSEFWKESNQASRSKIEWMKNKLDV